MREDRFLLASKYRQSGTNSILCLLLGVHNSIVLDLCDVRQIIPVRIYWMRISWQDKGQVEGSELAFSQ